MNKEPETVSCFGLLVHKLFTVPDAINFEHDYTFL